MSEANMEEMKKIGKQKGRKRRKFRKENEGEVASKEKYTILREDGMEEAAT